MVDMAGNWRGGGRWRYGGDEDEAEDVAKSFNLQAVKVLGAMSRDSGVPFYFRITV